MQYRVHSLISISAIVTAATISWVEIDFLELLFLVDVGMYLCHYVDAGVYKSPFELDSQDSCVLWTNKCTENG